MKVIVNGKDKIFSDNYKLSDLIEDLKLNPDQIAVEINLEIIKKSLFSQTLLKENDRIEILHFVGGGKL